ncbi:MAG: hypothetical protein HP491_09310 [Nitrospira sp.]|nr:hypothetical protein [Nitrospira sp.]
MKTRISAIVCLLCVFGYSDLSRAEDPSSQRVADPYADPYEVSPNEVLPNPPTMSSGTPELYLSVMTGIAMTRSADATFTDGSSVPGISPNVIEDVDYRNNFALGGNAGVWLPTRDKLWGFDLGMELTGLLWQADVGCCRDWYNNDPTGLLNNGFFAGQANTGTATEMRALYIGPNFLVRYPMGISDLYPNGRWHPYVGIGVGMHQMTMRPGGAHGIAQCCVQGGNLNTNPIPDQRDTTYGWMALVGVKAHLFKYVAGFVEAKYIQAHHDGLLTDRYGQSSGADGFTTFPTAPDGSALYLNRYSSSINTIMVNAGLSIHFDIKP